MVRIKCGCLADTEVVGFYHSGFGRLIIFSTMLFLSSALLLLASDAAGCDDDDEEICDRY